MKVPAPYSNGNYGLGTSIKYLYQLPIYGHSGNYIYRSQLWYLPFDSLSISVLSNQQLPSIAGVWNDLYFAYQNFIASQTCLPDGITFSSQAEIDDFQTNHPNCIEIEGDVTIAGDDITNLNGLSVLTSIGGNLSTGNFDEWNPNLTSLSGLENVTSIGGDLGIFSNNILTNLVGLDNLVSIGGDLGIGDLWTGNPKLTSLTGLENLTSIGGDLSIKYNDTLINLTGLDNLTSIGGTLMIASNSSLTHIDGLVSLTSLEENLYIGHNSLTSLSGLGNVISIGGNFSLGYSYYLTSLTGLDNLTSIGGILNIHHNTALLNLVGLENLDAGSIGNLSIHDNSSLSSCEAQSICDYLASPNGEIDIYDNAPGCNSQSQVEEACETITSNEIELAGNISIYPNPVDDILTFSSKEIKSVEIYDLMGALIIKRNSNIINMSNLNPGIYFVIGFDKNLNPLYKGKIVKN